MTDKNLQAIADVTIISPPQILLAAAPWHEKGHFDKLLECCNAKILAQKHLTAIIEIFKSHWFRIDHATINLGHEPLGENYANNEKLRHESKSRLFEVTDWFKNIGFRMVDEFYPKTGQSGMNSHVMSKGEVNFALNEGIDGLGESQISEYVRLWGEGVQHLALDAKVIMPAGWRVKDLVAIFQEAGFTFLTKIYEGEASDGQKLWQCFTDEVDKGFFYELIERMGERGRFVPGTIQGLYEDIEKSKDKMAP